MEKICQKCEYWDKIDKATGYCELQPTFQNNHMVNFLADAPYKMTDAGGTCEDFEAQDIELVEKMPKPLS
jgi:hypothetical protein